MLHLTLLPGLTHGCVIPVFAATQAAGAGGSGLHRLVHLPLPALQGGLPLFSNMGLLDAAVDVLWPLSLLMTGCCLLCLKHPLPGQPVPVCPAILEVESLPTAVAPVL